MDTTSEKVEKQKEKLREYGIEPKYISLSFDEAQSFIGYLWNDDILETGFVPTVWGGLELVFNPIQNRDIVVLASTKQEFKYHDKLDEIRNG